MVAAQAARLYNTWAVQVYDRLTQLIARGGQLTRYGCAVVSTALVTIVLARSHLGLEPANISLTYLLAVFFTASIAGLGPGITASLLAFLCYNLFFVEPLYMLSVASPPSLVRLTVFLIAALLASSLAALALDRAQLVRQVAEQEATVATDRFKATLLSSISHDLRTPLASIIGVATALRQGDVAWTSAAATEMLDTLIDEANRLNRLVGNLLEMSRIESGALEATRAWEEIGDITGGVLARLRPLLVDRPVRVAMAPDLPPVWVNAALLDQVLTNLIENVLKYTPAGTSLGLLAEARDDALWVMVVDQGPGLPEAMLPQLFDKFYRGSPPERAAQGTGLGLAICKGIVEAHGGQIWAENRAGGGAAFTFTLPLRPQGALPFPAPDLADLAEPPQSIVAERNRDQGDARER